MSKLQSMNKQELHISVRNLVEFIFREGDIDNRAGKLQQADAMQAGSRIHRKIQKSMGTGYEAEVPLKISVAAEDYILEVEGRADGIFVEERKSIHDGIIQGNLFDTESGEEFGQEEIWYIDEIKGIYKNVLSMDAPFYVHKAQAMCYAYIYGLQNSMTQMGVQMTYVNLDTEETKYFREIFSMEELRTWFGTLIERYKKWADFQVQWVRKRQESIRFLEFPFPYREGQKQLVTDVYRTIHRGKNVFIQAPTGVGKTISTIFPTVKAMGEGLVERIFYLTAKTITATVAKETFALLSKQGYVAKTIQLTAKEKLCLCEEMECNPVHCPYAKGHYDRVNDAVYDLLQKSDFFTRDEILAQAEEFMVCPFELSLDVATWVDNIICDYNYVFDPNVRLKRFFQEGVKGKYAFLVDEAHNLVDRSREMYSAVLIKEQIMSVRRILKPIHKGLDKALEKCNKEMLSYKRACETYQVHEGIGVLMFHLMRVASLLEEFLEKPQDFPEKKEVLDFYFELRNFLAIYELVDEHYVIYSQMNEDGQFMMKLFCVDPSENLQKCLDKGVSTVFFSATLLPVNYYKQLLSTKEDNYAIYAHSTFSNEQRLLLFGRDVSTKYTRRNAAEYEKIAKYIVTTVQGKKGNYMVFFPSYKLMQDVADVFCELVDSDVTIFLQKSNMKEQEREEFLSAFEEEREGSMVAFCVMGGIFGEGIDLKNDRLIGAVIVGTGLPQISNEREILKNYYDARGLSGFDYAFRYPGINKVLQAAGRVIRTNEDKGVILLLDERFLQSDYDLLYPREWSDRLVCRQGELEGYLRDFWGEIQA